MDRREPVLDRRQFISRSSAAALLVAWHESIARAMPCTYVRLEPRRGPRIQRLRLQTACPLPKMKTYYRDLLGFGVRHEGDQEITFDAGATTLTFVKVGADQGAPFYHFAFNIPEQKILAARRWQLERTPLFETPENLRDPDYPDDVRHFRSWNAHSVFFFDPAENVLEYIARHDLPATRRQGTRGDGFDPRDILHASEIAFITDDVSAIADDFAKRFDLPQYRGGSDQFRAMGDEEGLLLVFATGREIGRGSGKSKPCEVFPTEATIRNDGKGETGAWSPDRHPYKVLAE